MSVRFLVHESFNLELSTPAGIIGKLATATFSLHGSFSDGKGKALGNEGKQASTATWGGTFAAKADKSLDDSRRGSCRWGAELSIRHPEGSVSPDDHVELALRRDFGDIYPSHELGRAQVTLRELAEMSDDGKGIELMLFDHRRFDNDGDVIVGGKDNLPTIVRLAIFRETLPEELQPTPSPREEQTFDKHLMIVARGKILDMQPFLTLARGLAEIANWEITVVTAIGHKSLVKGQADVKKGTVRFRPSGGDTPEEIEEKTSQAANNFKNHAQQNGAAQKIYLSRSEIDFFPSEPAIFYWAQKMKPDLLMFSASMASVTLIVSEALKIPVMGFVLQPTSIPSNAYPPILPITKEDLKKLDAQAVEKKHNHIQLLKFLTENAGSKANKSSLASLRGRRGLVAYKSYATSTWYDLKQKNFPLIVPINETLFGGKPFDWSENSVFTTGIFPHDESALPLADDIQSFVNGCKDSGGKVVVLAFSTMPMTKTKIITAALKIIKECKSKVYVLALLGKQIDAPFPDSSVEYSDAIRDGRLLLAPGAPYGQLFPLADAVVLKGGLGTLSEALKAGLPAIVTGPLLLDQRFWGSRCSEMGVGPFGFHSNDFLEKCVDYVEKAVEDGSVWRENASKIAKMMADEVGDDPSGVEKNVECVVRLSGIATPYHYDGNEEAQKQNPKEAKKIWFTKITKEGDSVDGEEIEVIEEGVVYVEAV